MSREGFVHAIANAVKPARCVIVAAATTDFPHCNFSANRTLISRLLRVVVDDTGAAGRAQGGHCQSGTGMVWTGCSTPVEGDVRADGAGVTGRRTEEELLEVVEHAGLATPRPFGHLLDGAVWDVDMLRDFVVAGLGSADAGGDPWVAGRDRAGSHCLCHGCGHPHVMAPVTFAPVSSTCRIRAAVSRVRIVFSTSTSTATHDRRLGP